MFVCSTIAYTLVVVRSNFSMYFSCNAYNDKDLIEAKCCIFEEIVLYVKFELK